MIGSVIVSILLAFSYRARGGAIPLKSTTLARLLFWCLPITVLCGIICLHHHIPLYMALISGLMCFLSISIGHAFAQGGSWLAIIEQALIGYARVGMIFLPLGLYYTPIIPLVFVGVTQCIAGLIGHKVFTDSTMSTDNIEWCKSGTEWEEFFTGILPYGLMISLIGI